MGRVYPSKLLPSIETTIWPCHDKLRNSFIRAFAFSFSSTITCGGHLPIVLCFCQKLFQWYMITFLINVSGLS